MKRVFVAICLSSALGLACGTEEDDPPPPMPMPECGDGRIDEPAGEQCEPESVETPTEDCDTDCTRPACGDGLVNGRAGEACDDGNTIDGDDCPASCRFGA